MQLLYRKLLQYIYHQSRDIENNEGLFANTKQLDKEVYIWRYGFPYRSSCLGMYQAYIVQKPSPYLVLTEQSQLHRWQQSQLDKKIETASETQGQDTESVAYAIILCFVTWSPPAEG